MNPRFSLAAAALILLGAAIALWWSDRQPGTTPATTSVAVNQASASETREPPAPAQSFTLAISWHPAFCEQKPNLSECRGQASADFEASNLTLHGLWPEDEYCGVSDSLVATDSANRWNQLPEPKLSNATWRKLATAMPGVEDNLHRHEWVFHGTCSGANAETYFKRSLDLLDALNASPVRDLLSRNIGKHVSRNQIRAAFDAAFGDGAGRKVRVDCDQDGGRTLISELRINLYGEAMGDAAFTDLIHAGRNAGAGCSGGIVDRVGRQ